MSEQLYDVVAVSLVTTLHTVRLIDRGKTLRNAEAVRDMAVIRRGVDEEFFIEVRSGAYREGDVWKGQK